jgi:hypothetical protein
MVSSSAESAGIQATAVHRQRTAPDAITYGDRPAIDHAVALPGSARRFAARCHSRQRRPSDGAPFIEHPLEVARLLRAAGCSDVVVAAGLLHDVVEHTDVSVAELRARFGSAVADLVQAVSDDASIPSYRRRKLLLLEQVRCAGGDAALLFAADKIAKVCELPDLVRRDRARSDRTARGHRGRDHLDDDHQMRIEHYHESLVMLQGVAAGHPLVVRLASELDSCPITMRAGATVVRL